MHMRINIRAKPKGVDVIRKLEHIDSKVDVIPFITMKYLSQKQTEQKDNLSDFQDKYGIIFRDYELLTNIIKKHKKDESVLSDVKSALNVLKNSTNDDIKEIYSDIDEEKITKEILDDIIEILESEDDYNELYEHVKYIQTAIKDEKNNPRIIPPTIKLLSQLASANHKTKNIYNPSSKDAIAITALDEFEHATLYVKSDEDYIHAKQNFLINNIPLDKITLINQEILVDESEEKYDTIISVPYPRIRRTKNMEKYSKFETTNPNNIYLLNLIEHMDENGKIVTISTQDLLVKNDAYKLRKYLIEQNLLDMVVDYESGFRTRDITILVLNNNKKTDDFLFIKIPELLPGFSGMFDDNILEIYEKREEEPKFSSIINKDEIIKNEYNLNPKRYVYTLEYEEKPVTDIINEQKEYSKEIRKLDDEIEQLLDLNE